jgi:hypothetical protein
MNNVLPADKTTTVVRASRRVGNIYRCKATIVTLTITATVKAYDVKDVNHNTIPAGTPILRFSLVGDMPGACYGQIADSLERCMLDRNAMGRPFKTDLTLGKPKLRRLLELWALWHLNDMRPGCAHQVSGPYVSPIKDQICAESGYKYGSAWLHEQPHPEHIRELCAIFKVESPI